MKIKCELTDTFGGEPNYSWVRRAEIEVPEDASESLIVRRSKKTLGLSGVRCRKSTYCGIIRLVPTNSCTVAFINSNW